MKKIELQPLQYKLKHTKTVVLFLFLLVYSLYSSAQVASSVDSLSIKIGSQITYKIKVETDTTNLVIFPEGQTFSPLEMIESYKIDTLKLDAKYKLIKQYGLTQFDSGKYTIPKQKILIGNKVFNTDSINVEVRNIVVDTTKQGLYSIKPIIEVKKTYSNRFWLILGILTALAVIAFIIYWFVWRKKPLSEEQKIALLPPYDRAKLALQKLDETNYLQNEALKDYYSELTFIIRKYLDEKVYDRALESTTDELIDRLNILTDGNQIDFNKDDIKKIESILKRADLVKFAKSNPDIELVRLDRQTIDLEIDQVKEALPEPTEEEKLLDQQYKEAQARKKKTKKIWITVALSLFLLMATFTGFGLKYGFGYVKDTIIGHETKQLLEQEWYTSDYGVPTVTASTPEILKREDIPIPKEFKNKLSMTTFAYELKDKLTILISTTTFKEKQKEIDPLKAIEGNLKSLESEGAKNIVTINDKFTTPNGAEGIKTHGTLSLPKTNNKDEFVNGKYQLLVFTSDGIVLQQMVITWLADDEYADQIVERFNNSLELKQKEN